MTFVLIYIVCLTLLFYKFILEKLSQETRKKVALIYTVVISVYAGITFFLSQGWYTQNSVSFHWFNDSDEWLLMDKVGHFFTSAAWSRFSVVMFNYAGLDKKMANSYMVWLGFLLLSSVEYFDGLSPDYGASLYDIIANFLGALLVYIQYKYLGKMRFFSKWSYWPNALALLRPNILGNNSAEQLLKNYNGHIFWISTPLKSIFKNQSIPPWLCLSIGYGAEGMIGGSDNIWSDSSGIEQDKSNVLRYRQIYISLDVMIESKEGDSVFKKMILHALSLIKVPFPAIEFNVYQGIVFHWIAI